MLMTNYVEKEMTQERMPMSGGSRFDVNSSGIGDVRISGLIKILQDNHQNMILGMRLSIPTGSIDRRDVTLLHQMRVSVMQCKMEQELLILLYL